MAGVEQVHVGGGPDAVTRPWVKLEAQTHRRLDALLSSDADRVAYYAAIEEAKLAESEGEWADDAEFAIAVGKRLARSLPSLLAAGLLERTVDGWVRVVGWVDMTKTDPTNADRQKRWRDKHRPARNALRALRNEAAPATGVTAGQIDREKEKERSDVTAALDGRAADAPMPMTWDPASGTYRGPDGLDAAARPASPGLVGTVEPTEGESDG
jgi:hypothetical protein